MSPAQRSNRVIVVATAAISLFTIFVVAVPRGDSSPKAASSSPTSTVVPTSTTATSTTEASTDDDERWIDFEPAAPIVSVFPDERLPAVSTPSELDDSVPSRPAALVPHPFDFGVEDENDIAGLTEPEHAKRDLYLGNRAFACASITLDGYEFDTDDQPFISCGRARTTRGDFLLVTRSASLNAYDRQHIAAVAIDVLVLRTTSTGKRIATVASKAYISRDLCSPGSYLEVGKIRVGDDEVFVVDVNGQLSVLAMNDEGMPEVVASYASRNKPFTVTATDRSLILASQRQRPLHTVREMFPSDSGWRERIHLTEELTDPRYKYVENDPRWVHFDPTLTTLRQLVTYQFRGYSPTTEKAACDPVYRRTVYAD